MLGAAAAGPGMAGAGCRRGCPWKVGLALPSWRQAWAWAWVWLQVEVVVRPTGLGCCLAAVFCFGRAAGLGFAGAWALAAAGLLALETGLGPIRGVFPAPWGLECWTRK